MTRDEMLDDLRFALIPEIPEMGRYLKLHLKDEDGIDQMIFTYMLHKLHAVHKAVDKHVDEAASVAYHEGYADGWEEGFDLGYCDCECEEDE